MEFKEGLGNQCGGGCLDSLEVGCGEGGLRQPVGQREQAGAGGAGHPSPHRFDGGSVNHAGPQYLQFQFRLIGLRPGQPGTFQRVILALFTSAAL